MNRFLPSILLGLLAAACHRTAAAADVPGTPGIRVELVSKKGMDSLDGEVRVRFKVKNETAKDITYQGFSEDLPTYAVDVQTEGAWTQRQIGWCGTGILDFTLQPGAEMEFDLNVPNDKRTYRAKFGEPLVVTPPVVAEY
ncbi:MAG: hypothetical protein ACKVXR_08925 [Planctomycetota bacterium]